eukprot:gene18660-17395_t
MSDSAAAAVPTDRSASVESTNGLTVPSATLRSKRSSLNPVNQQFLADVAAATAAVAVADGGGNGDGGGGGGGVHGEGGGGGSASGSGGAARHDFLLNELVASDGQLGPTLRAVYDGSGADSVSFVVKLDALTKTLDGEIERICNKHYQGFIESIGKLINVKESSTTLKSDIEDTNEALLKSGGEFMGKLKDLVEARTIQRNILTTIEEMTNCLSVIKLYCSANNQIKERRYYPALKTLRDLELMYLQDASALKYSFTKLMRETVPLLRLKVKHATSDELKTFLTDIRVKGQEIGQVAMRQMQRSQEEGEDEGGDVDGGVEDGYFHPLYRCLHIYEVMGIRSECEAYYKEERKKQAQLVL